MKNQTLFNSGGGGGYLEKSNPSFSKKFLFSLATVSVLSTCAEAQISGCGISGNCGTVSEEKTDKITVSGTGNTTLTITNSGSVKPSNDSFAIEFTNNSSLTNFKNEGTIQGGGNKEAIKFKGTTIDNFENTGLISGNWSGLEINEGNNYIKTFKNNGTIKGTGSGKNGIFLKNGTIDNFINESNGLISGTGIGIKLDNSTIKTFKNSGTIKANKAIELSKGTIENFTNDSSGTIQGNEAGIVINSHINTFTNEGLINSPGKGRYNNGIWISSGANIQTFTNSGTIVSNGEKEPGDNITSGTSSSIKITQSHIKTFDNQGSISGKFGVKLLGATIDNFKNSGTIESNSKHKNGAAISISNIYGVGSTITNFENSGTIKANNASGILIEAGK